MHSGHLKVADSFLKSGLIDELLILPTPFPPHKKEKNQTPFHHRLKMLEIAFVGRDRVKISDLEANLPSPSYTLQSIRYLKKDDPDTQFFLCLGEDNLKIFEKWYKSDEILKETVLIIAERPGFDSSGIPPKILERAVFVEHHPVDASSTEVRDAVEQSGDLLPENVAEYIEKHGLYQDRKS